MTWATTLRSAGAVRYGPAGSCTAYSVTSAALGSPIGVNGTREYQNSAVLTGLAPDTGYCYRITTGGTAPVDLLGREASPGFSTLETAAGTEPFTFDVMNDWGDTTNSGVNNGTVNVNQAAIDSEISTSGAEFLISIGDTAYQDGSQTNYGDLQQSGPYISDVFGPSYWAVPGQRIPVFQGSGDHGRSSTVLSVWPEPATTAGSGGVDSMVSYPAVDGTAPGSYPTSYYAFSTGGVRFYLLDAAWGYTNVGHAGGASCPADCAMYQVDHDQHWTASSAEYRWLVQDLAAHRGGLKLAFFHFPLYSDDGSEPGDSFLDHTPGRTGSLEQLLHDNGVGLAFNGHAHDYQRNIAGPGGVTSYVTGGGGGSASAVGLNACATTDAYAVGWIYGSHPMGTACGAAARPATDAQVYHFLKVTVAGTNVTVIPTDAHGRTFDVQTYRFAPDTTPPSAPGHLTVAQPGPARTVLAWTAATDNIGISAYDLYRDGTYLATVGPGVTSYTDTTASPQAGYAFRVAARDLAGNATSANVTVPGGAPVLSDGFESGTLSKWQTVSGLAVQSALAHTGRYAARETSTAAATYADAALPGRHTDMRGQAWVYVVSRATSASLFGFRAAGGRPIAEVSLSPAGMLTVRTNIGGTIISASAVAPGGWHLVSLHAVVDGTAGRLAVSLDGTPVPGLVLTGQNLGARPIAAFQLGDPSTGHRYDIALDDVSVAPGR